MTKMTQGGKREGAGRKPNPDGRKKPRAFKLARDVDDFLATQPNATATVEAAVRGTKPFKAWIQNKTQ